MKDIELLFGGIGVALMNFRTDLEIALADLRKAFEHARQLREAADESTNARLAKCDSPLAKAEALLKALQEEGEAMRAGLDEIAAGLAACRAAMPDFQRHICGPTPRPRGVDPIEALRNGVTIDHFIRSNQR